MNFKTLTIKKVVMKNSFKTLILFGMAMTLQACVVGPPIVDGTYTSGTGVGVDYDYVEPRVHYGTRSSVRVWLHPNYALPDAYDLAMNHCRRYGLWPRPYRDWSYQTSSGRYLNYNCVGRRPNVSRLHIHRRPVVNYHPRRGTVAPNRPVVGRPVNSRPHHRPNVTSPSGRPRPVYSPPPRRGSIAPPKKEVGKPWEHNPNKGSIHTRPTPSKNEVGKPWTHNPSKNTISNRPPSSRPSVSTPSSSSGRPTGSYDRPSSSSTRPSYNRSSPSSSRPSYSRGSSSSSSHPSPPSSRGSSSQRRSTLAL